MGGIVEFHIFSFPSRCNIGSKNNLFPKTDINLKKTQIGVSKKHKYFNHE